MTKKTKAIIEDAILEIIRIAHRPANPNLTDKENADIHTESVVNQTDKIMQCIDKKPKEWRKMSVFEQMDFLGIKKMNGELQGIGERMFYRLKQQEKKHKRELQANDKKLRRKIEDFASVLHRKDNLEGYETIYDLLAYIKITKETK